MFFLYLGCSQAGSAIGCRGPLQGPPAPSGKEQLLGRAGGAAPEANPRPGKAGPLPTLQFKEKKKKNKKPKVVLWELDESQVPEVPGGARARCTTNAGPGRGTRARLGWAARPRVHEAPARTS